MNIRAWYAIKVQLSSRVNDIDLPDGQDETRGQVLDKENTVVLILK